MKCVPTVDWCLSHKASGFDSHELIRCSPVSRAFKANCARCGWISNCRFTKTSIETLGYKS